MTDVNQSVGEFVFRSDAACWTMPREHLFAPEAPAMALSQMQQWNEVARHQFLASYLHLLTHRLLSNYVSGATGGRYWLPLHVQKCYSSTLMHNIAQVLSALAEEGCGGTDLVEQISAINQRSGAPAFQLAEVIGRLYELLGELGSVVWSSALVERQVTIEGYKSWRTKASNREGLTPIHALQQYVVRHLKSDLTGFYLHGSFATLDYVYGYSDCDVLAVIHQSVLKDPKRLLQLRRKLWPCHAYLFQIDPLQHHGPFILAEQDFQWYPQAFLPLVLLENGVSLHSERPTVLKVRSRPDLLEKWQHFVGHRNALVRMAIEQTAIDSLYQLKRMVQIFILSPCLYLQIVDDYYYKRDALGRMAAVPQVSEAIRIATHIRETLTVRSVLPAWASRLFAHWNPATLFGFARRIKPGDYQPYLNESANWARTFLVAFEYLYAEAKRTLHSEAVLV